MPPAKKPRWEHRPQRVERQSGQGSLEPTAIVRAPTVSAQERLRLYVRLLWLHDYSLVFAAEATLNAPLLDLLKGSYTSAHSRRLMGIVFLSILFRLLLCAVACSDNDQC